MSNELNCLSRAIAAGKIPRRHISSRTTALGATATFANTPLANPRAECSLTQPVFADFSNADRESFQGRVEDSNHEAASAWAAGRAQLNQG